VVKRGGKLGEDPPAEALHRLRIDAKKLRYLLELFRSLYRDDVIRSLVKELKRLQDILGGFNDMEVQQARLTDFGHDLLASGTAEPETLMAMGRLQAILEQRQAEYRTAFASRFAGFATDESRNHYRRTFGRRGKKP
jgi:CHAD domain-containing protein